MNGGEIEKLIYDRLHARYPEGPVWFDEDSERGVVPPLEVRMLYAFNAIEYNIANGGWSQFLWNCLSNWRVLLDTAQAGYLLIGAPEQAEALNRLRELCEHDEAECLSVAEGEDGSMDAFAEYTQRSYISEANDWEQLFWESIYEQRLAWLEENEFRIRTIIDHLDA